MKFINNLAYEASAGSGKTFMLVVRYLTLLFKGADPAKILALTFTNKAALEMQDRVILTLERLEDRDELKEIISLTQLSREEILKQRGKILHKFLNSNVKIMTIDKFFTTILRKFSLYTSLMPNFTTSSSQHEIKLLSRFLKEVSVASKKDILIDLTLIFNKRVSDIFTVLDQLYIKKNEFKNISFTKQDQTIYELEAFKNLEKLKEIIESCSVASASAKNAFNVKDFNDLATKSWIERESLDYRTFKKCYKPEMDIYLKNIKEAIKNQRVASEQNFFYALFELLEIYEKSKKALYLQDSELSFNDVSILVYYLLKEHIDKEFLYFRLDADIEHILLDEFQDTSVLQYEILKPLIDEVVSGNAIFNDSSFFFVGDVKQSIYRFRGGVSALFYEVAKKHNTDVKKLKINYRSKKAVVEFVNETFINKIKNYTPQEVRDGVDGGYVEVIDSEDILDKTLSCIKSVIDSGAILDNIAILCATNSDGESIKNLLIENGIDVVTETTTKLINQQSIKAILEYLKYLYFGSEIYRYNFFALIQKELEPIYKIDLTKKDLVDIVKDVIDRYSLFSNEFHIIRFLNVVRKYGDIEALLFEYERLDILAASSDLKGVRVLTIHKSKGLEYETVIVMDRLKKQPPSRDLIIYEYDSIELKNIYMRFQKRDKVDSNYANALQKDKDLIYEDNLNALYVAFTRAKNNLFIIKKEKDSIFSNLDLNSGYIGEISFYKNKTVNKKEVKELKYKDLYYGTQSNILELKTIQDENIESINFGLAMHYMLEVLSDFTQDSIEDAKYIMLNKYGNILTQSEIVDIENRVSLLLKSSDFLNILSSEYYKEKAIKYKKNLYYIDLLIKDNNRWIVVDYKSSKNNSNEHIKQVKNYINVVRNITNEDVDGYLCYLLEDSIDLVKII